MNRIAARLVAWSFVALTISSPASAQVGDFTDRLEAGMADVMGGGAPGVIVFVREGADVTRLATGLGNLDPETVLAASDRTRIGSLAKTFVAVSALQLVVEGKLRLDGTVEASLPGLVPNGANITVRELLNHTSGIFDYWQDEAFFNQLLSDPTQVWEPDQLVAMAVAHPPLAGPGTAWAYSNTNYILLGRMIEVATGHTLAAELDARIFTPLGLDDTTFDSTAEIAGSHAHGYALLGPPEPLDVTFVNPTSAWAAGGGLVSTAEDVADFYAALLGGRLLPPELMAQMLTTVPAREGLAYGLGIADVTLPCGSAWGHQGEFPGYLSFALSGPDGSRQAVVLVNFYSLSDEGRAAFQDLVATAFCG